MKKIGIFAALATSFLLAACGGPYELSREETAVAENGALKFATAAGYTFVSVSGQDSNKDGYVTATFKKPDGGIFEAVCSYRAASGCKSK